ncbi:MAG: hypothetical protein K1X89_08405 [Myxococcaceae bacterium]|nr:hypothetical protein [Myxococcaceae bacterium]
MLRTTFPVLALTFFLQACSGGSGGASGGGSGSSGGGTSSSGGGSSAGGGTGAMPVVITGVSGATDLWVTPGRAYFIGEVTAGQPAIFAATTTATAATVVCKGPAGATMAGLVPYGTALFAFVEPASGPKKIVKANTSDTNATCTEVGTVTPRSFSFGGNLFPAQVAGSLVYPGESGAIMAFNLTANTESTLLETTGGVSYFPLVQSAGGAQGVVARATNGQTAELKLFTLTGVGATVDSFNKPEFTTVGTKVVWAVDGTGGVTFKSLDTATAGAAAQTGATANLGPAGRTTFSFCRSNDGATAAFVVSSAAGDQAGYYRLPAGTAQPTRLTTQSYDAPLHCGTDGQTLWFIEGQVGGTRRVLRVQ